jgi:MFS family permease
LVGILFGFVPVYLNSIGYDPLNERLVLSAGTLAYLAVQSPAGCWADRYGGGIAGIIGSVVSSLSTVFLAFTQGLLFVALVVLGGSGTGVV